MYTFQTESTPYICQNNNQLLALSRRYIWSLRNCTGTGTRNHLLCKRKLNHFTKLSKWLSWVASTYLYGVFDYIFLSCQVGVADLIHILYLPECQGIPSSKQVQYLKMKWLQCDSNPQLLNTSTNTQAFGQTDKMIELNCEYLSVRWIWLYLLIMSRTRFRVNSHPIFAWL